MKDKKKPITLSPILSEILRVFIPSLLLVVSILFVFYFVEQFTHLKIIKTEELARLEGGKKVLLKDVRTAVSDLYVLAENKAFEHINGVNKADAVNQLADNFLSLAKHKGIYDQIRYLDKTGMEVVRINFNAGQPAIVPVEKLQQKGQRYYFRDTFKLSRNQIFISPMDLNIEKGKIEQPLKAMIRLGMPVFDSQGKKTGIVLLNYLAQHLLDTVKDIGVQGISQGMLLNSDGYWLEHQKKDLTWAR